MSSGVKLQAGGCRRPNNVMFLLFNLMPNIEAVNLSNNTITVLDPASPLVMEKISQSLIEIDLRNNPLECSCALKVLELALPSACVFEGYCDHGAPIRGLPMSLCPPNITTFLERKTRSINLTETMTTPNTDLFQLHKADFRPRTEDKVFQEFSER